MRKILFLLIALLVASCSTSESMAGESTEITSPTSEAISQPLPTEYAGIGMVELAVRDLAFRTQQELNDIGVISIESVEWPDSGLGCPMPGVDYAQVLTPGYRITLKADGQLYTYHTNTEQSLVLCQDGVPELPTIPVNPGEIQDGEPWMPVDPVPTIAEGDTIADPDPVR
ncbi:MAG: hypothetical protein PVF49_04200 [Anaerolineales bacterium]|jgi:hypothetical protein